MAKLILYKEKERARWSYFFTGFATGDPDSSAFALKKGVEKMKNFPTNKSLKKRFGINGAEICGECGSGLVATVIRRNKKGEILEISLTCPKGHIDNRYSR